MFRWLFVIVGIVIKDEVDIVMVEELVVWNEVVY